MEEAGRKKGVGGLPGLDYKWSALSCTSLGALIATVNGGTLIIALPELARELDAPLFGLVWVILGYMLAQTALVLSRGLSASAAAPFISGLHAALLLMAGASVIGFFFSALRGSERDAFAIRQSGLEPSASNHRKERV